MKKVCKGLVMVIDDNEIDIFISKKVLELNKFANNILCLKSASEALKYLSGSNQLPDIIFLDLNMPIIDGFRFLHEFSKLPTTARSQIHVVILTSSDNDHDKEKAAANPYVLDYVSKPLNKEKLEGVIKNLPGAGMVVD